MSTQTSVNNAATVGSLYEAFGRGDIPFILSHIADNCHWIGAGGEYLPQGGTYTGKEAVNFFIRLNESVAFNISILFQSTILMITK